MTFNRPDKQFRKMMLILLLTFMLLCSIAALQSPRVAHAVSLNERGGISQGFNYSAADLDYAMNELVAAGGRWVRIDFMWSMAQTTEGGAIDYSYFENAVNAAISKGLKVIAIVDYTPPWANGGSSTWASYPDDVHVRDWQNYVYQAALHFIPKGVTVWEMWNEPNRLSNSDPAKYTNNILKPGANAVRQASNELGTPVTVLGGAMGIARPDYEIGMIKPTDFLTGIYSSGGKGYFDAISYHPYYWGDPTTPLTSDPYNFFMQTPLLYNIMNANGDGNKQIWGSEYGNSTYSPGGHSEAEQADLLTKAYHQWNAWSWTGPLITYAYRDFSDVLSDPEANFGMIRTDWSHKPAFGAYHDLMTNDSAVTNPAPATLSGGPSSTTVANGFQNLSQWTITSGSTAAADTSMKTEGSQSTTVTYKTSSGTWVDYNWAISPTQDWSNATELKLDVYPTSQTTGGTEPLYIKINNGSTVIYEQPVYNLKANQWNTVTVNLSGLGAHNQISAVNLYLWSASPNLNGRTQVTYKFDNLRLITPTTSIVNGFQNLSQWTLTAGSTAIADTGNRTEGSQSSSVTYHTSSGTWVNYNWGISPTLNWAGATKLKIDIYPTSQTAASTEPLHLKINNGSTVIYEQAISQLIVGQWNTVTINLTGTRTAVSAVNLYLWSASPSIEGRTQVTYKFDNLRLIP